APNRGRCSDPMSGYSFFKLRTARIARAFCVTVLMSRPPFVAVILGRAPGADIDRLTRITASIRVARARAASSRFPVMAEHCAHVIAGKRHCLANELLQGFS